MAKKVKIELNREKELEDIDAELDGALSKLQETTARVDEILAAETGDAGPDSGAGDDASTQAEIPAAPEESATEKKASE